MSTFYDILEQIRKESQTQQSKGTKFERLMRNYLKTSSRFTQILQEVWLWKEFPYKKDLGGIDTGIDLVAMTIDGEFWAIQCKCYADDTVIDKPAVDSFLSTSSREFKADERVCRFSQRIWVSTTEKWGRNAEEAIKNQNPPVHIITSTNIAEDNTVDWDKLNKGKKGKDAADKKLYPPKTWQKEALEKAHDYFKTNDRGKLIMACGTGKTFTSLRLVEQETASKGLILVMVPSIALINQTLNEWTNQSVKDIRAICVCSDSTASKRKNNNLDDLIETSEDLAMPACTDARSVAKQIYDSCVDADGMVVVFSTYQSIDVISKAQQILMGTSPKHEMALFEDFEIKTGDYSFDFIICDEAHRTTGATLIGDDESAFVRIHDNSYIKGDKRLYMTATPRLYGDSAKKKAEEKDIILCSMDDEDMYGKEIYRIGFGRAVELGALSDYKVLVLTLRDDTPLPTDILSAIQDEDQEINTDDAVKLVGCINALSKRVVPNPDIVKNVDPPLMHNAVAFTQNIRISKQTAKALNDYAGSVWNNLPEEKKKQTIIAKADHVDGTMTASKRNELIQWLKNAPSRDSDDNECRILCNVRCLSEGVDVPSLDAVIFMSQRNSPVDVVQSVGRVMRKSPGKKYGYIIIPVVIPAGADPKTIFDDGEKYKVIWTVLNALRAHDDRLNAYINKLQLNNDRGTGGGGIIVGGGDGEGEGEGGGITGGGGGTEIGTQLVLFNEQIQDALYAKLVTKLGTKRYWTQWAEDVAKIAQKHIERIKELVEKDKNYATAFDMYLDGLHKNINPTVTTDEAMQMLAQHLITKPVFDALFENYQFVENNPISMAMKNLLDLVDETGYEADQSTLKEFYKSVRSRCEGIDNASGKQKIIIELYDTFFKTAMPTIVDKLGIVYTPVEVVDFINQSVADVLKKEFKRNLTDANVHIIDPFTGTGTFITRMIQSGLIKPEDLPRKYANELHANEIVLLAYYIASINIENAYHDAVQQKQGEYTPFEGICLTDTFQLYEDKDKNVDTLKFTDIFPKNSKRVVSQMKQPIQVIVGNPPYSAKQKTSNDNAQNNFYPKLEERIAETYVAGTNATNKNAVYDSYIKAFRWASDRLDATNGGVIGFITNSGWLDSNAMNGVRKCFAKEFTSIYVYNLRGAIRGKSGDTAKREGQNVFDIMTGVAVTILVRNPKVKTEQATIYYGDIGDYLKRPEKLAKIVKTKSILAKDFTQKVLQPDEHGDWFNLRSDVFCNYNQINSEVKFDKKSRSIFNVHSRGFETARDAWIYNFSKQKASDNLITMRNNYNEQVKKVSNKEELNMDGRYISWSGSLIAQWQHKNIIKSNPEMRYVIYRPFCKHNLAWIDEFIHRKGQFKQFYPTDNTQNLLICVNGLGSNKDISFLITNSITDVQYLSNCQCFPLYWYAENTDEGGQVDMFADTTKEKYIRHDGITDWILNQAKMKYGKEVTKEDIFYYVYGLLHCPEYRTQFAADLKKMLPRLPLLDNKEDFVAFSQAGRQLADLHLNYENRKPPKTVKVDMSKENYHVDKMRFVDKNDKSIIEYNKDIMIKNIPLEAYEYVVNGRSAIEWIMERYQIKTDKDSGITNDPNDWAKEHTQPRYILDLLLSIITVSLETMKIVKALPKVKFE